MTETRTEHSGMGMASFVLSFFPGALFLALLLVGALLPDPERGRAYPPVVDLTPSAALLALAVLMLLFLTVLGLGLGVAGVLQRKRKRQYAALGMACGVFVLVIAYVQDELYLFFN